MAMRPYLDEFAGNPSSLHFFGRKSKEAIDEARKRVAKFLNCSPEEIIFTGSATEANNLAIFGVVKPFNFVSVRPHIITSSIEHSSVFEPCQVLEDEGAEVTYLPSTRDGFVKIADLIKALKKNTVLVSIIYANNEIGTIQPIAEISKIIKKFRKSEKFPLFHIDAVQGINYLDCSVEKLGVDLLSLSGQKIYGPKGVGALYIKRGVSIAPLIYGGGQEKGLRSGTENVAFIIGLGEAIRQVLKNKSKIAKIRSLRNKLYKGILKSVPGIKLNGSMENSLPNILNITFKGVEGEAVELALDNKGIAVSTGSACASHDLKPSRVLLAIGLSHEEAHGAIRFSLGRYTAKEEIDEVLKVLPQIIKRLRKISGYKVKK